MYNKVQCICISCDNCGETYQDEQTGYSLFNDEIQAHESCDNDEWLIEDNEHICPLCFIVSDEDEVIINEERKINKP